MTLQLGANRRASLLAEWREESRGTVLLAGRVVTLFCFVQTFLGLALEIPQKGNSSVPGNWDSGSPKSGELYVQRPWGRQEQSHIRKDKRACIARTRWSVCVKAGRLSSGGFFAYQGIYVLDILAAGEIGRFTWRSYKQRRDVVKLTPYRVESCLADTGSKEQVIDSTSDSFC